MAISFRGGVHVNVRSDKTVNCESKPVSACRIHVFGLAGASGIKYIPDVKIDDEVKVGQKIAHSADSWELPVHSSVSGRVDSVSEDAITVVNNSLYEAVQTSPPDENDEKALILALQNSGIADMEGGEFICGEAIAGVPPRYLIVDALQSEQYASALCRRAAENPEEVIKGIKTVQRLLKVRNVFICVSKNAREAEEAMRRVIRYDESVVLLVMDCKYPQQNKKVLIRSVTGKDARAAAKEGCIVTNSEIMYDVGRLVLTGMPATERIVTVGGSAVLEPDNFRVPFGAPVSFFVSEAKGFINPPERILLNGVMSGEEADENTIVTKRVSSIQAMLPEKERKRSGKCIRCGRCVQKCPAGLLPYKLNEASVDFKVDKSLRYDILKCAGCGVCTYVCPAGLPISGNIADMSVSVRRIRGLEAENE